MKFSFIFILSAASAVKINGIPSWDDGRVRAKNPLIDPSGIVVGDKIPNGPNPIKPSTAKGEWQGPTFAYKFSNDHNGPHKVEVFKHLTRPNPDYRYDDLVDGEEEH